MEPGPQCQMPQREGKEDGGVKRSFGNLAVRKLLVPTETSSSGNGSDKDGVAEIVAQHLPVGYLGAVLWTGSREGPIAHSAGTLDQTPLSRPVFLPHFLSTITWTTHLRLLAMARRGKGRATGLGESGFGMARVDLGCWSGSLVVGQEARVEDQWRRRWGEEEMRRELGRRQSSFIDGGRLAVEDLPVLQTHPRAEDEGVCVEVGLAEIEGRRLGWPDGFVVSNQGRLAGVVVLDTSVVQALPLHSTIRPKTLGTF